MNFYVNSISYKYSSKSDPVLKNVSFQIREAEITAIVGPSGCGKSTLVSILSGVIPTLMPNGEYEGSFDVSEDVNIAVVSQSPENQLFGYGVEDALAFGIENMGLPNAEIVERVEYVLDLLNIQHLRRRSIATLSGGQRQAVCIASALAMQPDILIMDEPVSSLDPNGKQMIQAVLNQLRAAGQSTVIVDNNLSWFSGIVDHVIGLVDGEVVFDGDKNAFYSDIHIQKKLGVSIPQEIEIYHRLSERIQGVNKFYTMEEAKTEISRLLSTASSEIRGHQPSPSLNRETAEEILTAEGICKSFQDGFRALIDINAGFEKGKVISILGQNGSGKTTLVKHLNGLYKPTKGVIRFRGSETTGKSVAQISKDIILVFQHPEHMLFEESVYKEITFCARAQNVPFSETEVSEVLEHYGLSAYKEEFPVNLSMGKKHLLTILSVLFSSAEVIILDEPTLGMDLHQVNMLEDIIRQLALKGKTVLIISHEIPLVFKLSDQIIVLNEGVKLAQDSKSVLAAREELFNKVNITLPPVVTLSKYLNLPEVCYDVESFVDVIASMIA